MEQLQYRYGSLEDSDPGELPALVTSSQVSVEPLLSNGPPFAETEMPETAEPLDQRDQVPQLTCPDTLVCMLLRCSRVVHFLS